MKITLMLTMFASFLLSFSSYGTSCSDTQSRERAGVEYAQFVGQSALPTLPKPLDFHIISEHVHKNKLTLDIVVGLKSRTGIEYEVDVDTDCVATAYPLYCSHYDCRD